MEVVLAEVKELRNEVHELKTMIANLRLLIIQREESKVPEFYKPPTPYIFRPPFSNLPPVSRGPQLFTFGSSSSSGFGGI